MRPRTKAGIIIRVLFVGAHLGKGGGLAIQMYQLFSALREQIDVKMIVLAAPGVHSRLADDQDVTEVGLLAFPAGIGDLRRAIRERAGTFDVLHVYDVYYGMPAAYLARAAPRLVCFGTDPILEMHRRYGLPGAFALRASLPWMLDGVRLVTNSTDLARRFARYEPTVIPNGVSPADLPPSRAEARHALGLPEDQPILLYVGKVIPVKRLEWFLEALRHLPEVRGLIVGDFMEEHYGDRYYRSLLSAYADVIARVVFTGEVPWERVGTYLAASDVFVFPSSFEGMPNAVMEAMAAAVPVVASDIPAHRELIRDGDTGFLARDDVALVRTIGSLLADPDLRHSVAARARARVLENFSVRASAERYRLLYERMLRS